MDKIETTKFEQKPINVGLDFNTLDLTDFIDLLYQKIKTDPSIKFEIKADWVNINKTRSAKALIDMYASKLHLDSITIRATRQQYLEDVNAFQSGVKWEEIKK